MEPNYAHSALVIALLALSFAQGWPSTKPKSNPNEIVDRIITNERELGNTIRNYRPMVSATMQPDNTLGFVSSEDHYFLGRVQFQQSKEEFFLDKRLLERMAGSFSKFYSMSSVGFASMIFVDRTGFDKNYQLRYMRSESLGDPLPAVRSESAQRTARSIPRCDLGGG